MTPTQNKIDKHVQGHADVQDHNFFIRLSITPMVNLCINQLPCLDKKMRDGSKKDEI